MIDEIKVHVVKYPDRENYVLRYRDPITGLLKTKSAGTPRKGEASKEAGKWQAELREGRYQKPSKMTWEALRDYYAANALTALASRTAVVYEARLNVFERTCNPQKLSDLTTAKVTGFATALRSDGAEEATIARHLRTRAHDLRRAFGFRWALLVFPVVLRELMRHEDIATTMKYYVGQNAEATADAIWAATGVKLHT
jgi:integrase